MGSIPCQGAFLGFGFDPRLGHVQEAANRCFSPFLPPFPICLESIKEKYFFNHFLNEKKNYFFSNTEKKALIQLLKIILKAFINSYKNTDTVRWMYVWKYTHTAGQISM